MRESLVRTAPAEEPTAEETVPGARLGWEQENKSSVYPGQMGDECTLDHKLPESISEEFHRLETEEGAE